MLFYTILVKEVVKASALIVKPCGGKKKTKEKKSLGCFFTLGVMVLSHAQIVPIALSSLAKCQ